MTNAELADEIERRRQVNSDEFLGRLLRKHSEQIIAALRQPSSDKVLVTESMVEAAAKWISESPLIEPKLPPPAWMGLARHILQKAFAAAEAEGHHE